MSILRRIFPLASDLDQYPASVDLPRRALPFFWHFVKVFRWPVAVLVIGWSLGAIFMGMEPFMFGKLVGYLSLPDQALKWHRITQLCILYVVFLQIVSRACIQICAHTKARFYPVMQMVARRQLANYLYRHSYRYFQEDFAGRLAGKVFEMPEALHLVFEDTLDTLLWTVISASTALVLLVITEWHFAIVTLLFFFLTFLNCRWRVPKFNSAAKDTATRLQLVRGRYLDSVSNILLIKLFSREKYEDNILKDRMGEASGDEQRRRLEGSIFGLMQRAINALLQVSLLLLSLYFYSENRLSVGGVAIVLGVGLTLTTNSWYVLDIGMNFLGRFALINDALATIVQDTEIADTASPLALPPGQPTVVLDHISFAYPGCTVFTDFSLTIPAGQRLGLVGASGAGKSTLMQLLLRLFDVQEGAITLNGIDIKSLTQAELRHHIAVIPQSSDLMHRSVRENIAYGRLEAVDSDIIAAAQKAHIHETILKLSDQHGNTGYDAIVGERGVKLSGGQRQRIAIARAFLKDAPILILDEATASLDSESERLIQASLRELLQGKTAIVIAHRLSTIAHLDRIVVFEDGKIAEDGTHQELLAGNGLYSRLWTLQSEGFLGQ